MYNNEIFNPSPIPASAYADGSYTNYKLGVYTPSIQVLYRGRWESLPQTAPGCTYTLSSFVTEARNAKARFVGKKIGRDQIKISNITFPFLYTHEWTKILSMIDIGTPTLFRFFDIFSGREIQRTLYPNDRTATIYAYAKQKVNGENTYRPEILANCSFNLIDRGD